MQQNDVRMNGNSSNNILKFLQRRLYSYLGTWIGCTSLLALLVLSFTFLVGQYNYSIGLLASHSHNDNSKHPCQKLRGSSQVESVDLDCSEPSLTRRIDFYDNIGNVNAEEYVAFGPIDVVYTWINGSDPVWLAKKELWVKKYALLNDPEQLFPKSNSSIPLAAVQQPLILTQSDLSPGINITVAITGNSSLSAGNATTGSIEVEDDTMSKNRYRDNYELKYSLRSLIKNAPWIRRIFIVTDNQIPSWLNLESKDHRVTMISHEDIFANKSHLPVFSSPAIESQLHNIPGLSKLFIYFNDDVFLGAPVRPDDFISLSGAQKLYTSWDVPKCAPGCSDSWIGDGYCDKACNISSCFYDYPDCINGSTITNLASGGNANNGAVNSPATCAKGCPDGWLADRVCDIRCKNEECGWDAGDCGIDLVTGSYPGVYLPVIPRELYDNYTAASIVQQESHEVNRTGNASEVVRRAYDLGVQLQIPLNTKAFHVNISTLACLSTSSGTCDNSTERSAFVYSLAERNDKVLLHTAVLLTKHSLIVGLLYHSQGDAPPIPSMPHDILLKVSGKNAITGREVSVQFTLRVILDNRAVYQGLGIPEGLESAAAGQIIGHVGQCSSRRNEYPLSFHQQLLITKPFRLNPHLFMSLSPPSLVEGVAVFLEVRKLSPSSSSLFLSENMPVEHIHIHYKTILRTGRTYYLKQDLCSAVSYISTVNNYTVLPIFKATSNLGSRNGSCPPTFGLFLQTIQEYREEILTAVGHKVAGDVSLSNTPVLLQVPMPMSWSAMPSSWSSVEISIVYSSPTSENQLQHQQFFSSSSPDIPASDHNIAVHESAGSSYGVWHSMASNESTIGHLSRSASSNETATKMRYKQIGCLVLAVKWGYNASMIASLAVNTTELHSNILINSSIAADVGTNGGGGNNSDVNQATRRSLYTSSMEERDTSTTIVFSYSRESSTKQRNNYNKKKKHSRRRRNLSASSKVVNDATSNWSKFLSSWSTAVYDFSNRLINPFIRISSADTTATNKASKDELEDSIEAKTPLPSRRKLLDTYGSSLVFVNRLYHIAFGQENRKVPAHMPHLINTDTIREMQARWPVEWNETSSHRFRSPRDMQYSFSYYYYTSQKHKAVTPNLEKYIANQIDSNHDGYLNDNEFRTLLTIVLNRSPSSADQEAIRGLCFANVSHFHRYTEELPGLEGRRVVHTIESSITIQTFAPSIQEALNCSNITSGLLKNVNWNQYWPTHVMTTDAEVSFEMIGDNVTEVTNQLDSVRRRQSKFICINDNMKNESHVLSTLLHDFLESFYPIPSPFELPSGVDNPTLYWDQYKAKIDEVTTSSRRKCFQHSLLETVFAAVHRLWFIWSSTGSQPISRGSIGSHQEKVDGYRFQAIHTHRLQYEYNSEKNAADVVGEKQAIVDTPTTTATAGHVYISIAALAMSLVGLVWIMSLQFSMRRLRNNNSKNNNNSNININSNSNSNSNSVDVSDRPLDPVVSCSDNSVDVVQIIETISTRETGTRAAAVEVETGLVGGGRRRSSSRAPQAASRLKAGKAQ